MSSLAIPECVVRTKAQTDQRLPGAGFKYWLAPLALGALYLALLFAASIAVESEQAAEDGR